MKGNFFKKNPSAEADSIAALLDYCTHVILISSERPRTSGMWICDYRWPRRSSQDLSGVLRGIPLSHPFMSFRVLQSRGRSSPLVSTQLKSAPTKSLFLPMTSRFHLLLSSICKGRGALCSTSAGEVTAIVVGAMCGCVGLAVIVRFVVKTAR